MFIHSHLDFSAKQKWLRKSSFKSMQTESLVLLACKIAARDESNKEEVGANTQSTRFRSHLYALCSKLTTYF